MDHRKIITLAFILFGIAGCRNALPSKNRNHEVANFLRYENSLFNYSLDVPAESYRTPRSHTGTTLGFINYDHTNFPPPQNGYYISIQALSICGNASKGGSAIPEMPPCPERESTRENRGGVFSRANCSPILTGAPEVVELPMERGTAAWGKVNYNVVYPLMDHAEGQPEPLCPPETPFTGNYAFCSEYEGKTVVVCISQQTDNPAMAEEIFRTFRWLPEDQRSSSSSS